MAGLGRRCVAISGRVTPPSASGGEIVLLGLLSGPEPIVLTLYGPEGEVAVPMVPKRALTLAQELLTRGVQAIKADLPG